MTENDVKMTYRSNFVEESAGWFTVEADRDLYDSHEHGEMICIVSKRRDGAFFPQFILYADGATWTRKDGDYQDTITGLFIKAT